MAKQLTVTRTTAIAVFSFCLWKSAEKWDNERMKKKLHDIKDVLPDGEAPEEIKNDLVEILATINDGGEFTVVDDETSKSPEATTAPAKAPKEPKEPKAPKEPKPAKEPKEKGSKKGRPYYAAVAFREAGGQKVEITDALIARVDTLTGKPNPKESKAWLLIASQIITGWESVNESKEAPADVPAANPDAPSA